MPLSPKPSPRTHTHPRTLAHRASSSSKIYPVVSEDRIGSETKISESVTHSHSQSHSHSESRDRDRDRDAPPSPYRNTHAHTDNEQGLANEHTHSRSRSHAAEESLEVQDVIERNPTDYFDGDPPTHTHTHREREILPEVERDSYNAAIERVNSNSTKKPFRTRSRSIQFAHTHTGNSGRIRASFSSLASSSADNTILHTVESLINYLTQHASKIAHDKDYLRTFEELTAEVLTDTHDTELTRIVKAHGWTGTRYRHSEEKPVETASLLQSLSNLYLKGKLAQYTSHITSLFGSGDEKGVDQILSFVPDLLLTCLQATGPPQGHSSTVKTYTFTGACMLADISGFSKFSGAMCLKGASGLDDLREATSGFLGHLVRTVYDFQGDVVAFAGDALICVFIDSPPEKNASPSNKGKHADTDVDAELLSLYRSSGALRALRCACILRHYCNNRLSAHLGVSYGEMKLALLGGLHDQYVYLMNGESVSELSKCIDDAGPKQVAATRECYEEAQRCFDRFTDRLQVLRERSRESNDSTKNTRVDGNNAENDGISSPSVPPPMLTSPLLRQEKTLHAQRKQMFNELMHRAESSAQLGVDPLNAQIHTRPCVDETSTNVLVDEIDDVFGDITRALQKEKERSERLREGVSEADKDKHTPTHTQAFSKKKNVNTPSPSHANANNSKERSARRVLPSLPQSTEQGSSSSHREREAQISLIESAATFIPRPILSAVYAESLEHIGELRQVTTMFLSLDSYSPTLHRDPASLQPFFLTAQRSLFEAGGFLRQFLIDDKGCVFIAMWGMPTFTYANNCSRALFCAVSILKTVLKELSLQCSIGITTGNVFCGAVGARERRDYAGIGNDVNLAARLMSKAKGRVLTDHTTYANLNEATKALLTPAEEMKLKGMAEPITPFQYDSEEIPLIAALDETPGDATVLKKQIKAVLSTQMDRITNRLLINAAGSSTLSLQSVKDHATIHHNLQLSAHNMPHRVSSSQSQRPAQENANIHTSSHVNSLTHARSQSNSNMSVSNQHTHSHIHRTVSALSEYHANPSLSSANEVFFTIILGLPGTGKSTAAEYFRNGLRKRNIPCLFIQARPGHEGVPYGLMRELFLELIGDENFSTEAQQRRSIASLVEQAFSEESDSEKERARRSVEAVLGVDWSETAVCGSVETSLRVTSQKHTPLSQTHTAEESETVDRRAPLKLTNYKNTVSSPSNHSSHRKKNNSSPKTIVANLSSLDLNNHRNSGNNNNNSNKSLSAQTPTNAANALVLDEYRAYSRPQGDLAFYKVLAALFKSTRNSALVIEDAHFCDELSWNELHLLLTGTELNLVVVITMRSNPVLSKPSTDYVNNNSSNKNNNNTTYHPFDHGGIGESSNRGSTKRYSVYANNINSHSPHGEGSPDGEFVAKYGVKFQTPASYLSILGHENSIVVEMTALNDVEVQEILQHTLRVDEVSAHLVKLVLEVSSGNPFWCKMIAHFIKERGVKEFEKAAEVGDSRQSSLKQLILLRMEKLNADVQLVLKHASIIGDEFSEKMLVAVLPEKLKSATAHALDALVEHGFVTCIEEFPAAIFGFENQFIRQTIFELTPPRDAALTHFSAAQFIETEYAKNLRPFYPILAHHYTHSIGKRALAFKYKVKAADQAISRGAYNDGLHFAQAAARNAVSKEELRVLLLVISRALRDFGGKTPVSSSHRRSISAKDLHKDSSSAEAQRMMPYLQLKISTEAALEKLSKGAVMSEEATPGNKNRLVIKKQPSGKLNWQPSYVASKLQDESEMDSDSDEDSDSARPACCVIQ